MKKLKLKEFQLSLTQYLVSWDKLNKSDHYPELSIENADLFVDDRLVNSRETSVAMAVDGTWLSTYLRYAFLIDNSMACSQRLLDICLVPQPIYPDSYHSNAINTLLKSKLREHALHALSSSLKRSIPSYHYGTR
ncbi:uncharacterized protein F5891DRAFT_1191326 [Suillus fuscotomentosus]|uniref:Uncharacterized protein n=1 Tax=Suillus fuscotomentosus TaxID=1912939 RepID=A0AAD4HJR3_9AGAM|nr:uncharacterized protein F5891DRAFT_1191326 [Suillus fuscotomentosus]KAG1898019.1 hypothetical protein F5891DRAFT_1191326 [Suillus fuscotomentosus]